MPVITLEKILMKGVSRLRKFMIFNYDLKSDLSFNRKDLTSFEFDGHYVWLFLLKRTEEAYLEFIISFVKMC